jgi:hypothetical protein
MRVEILLDELEPLNRWSIRRKYGRVPGFGITDYRSQFPIDGQIQKLPPR